MSSAPSGADQAANNTSQKVYEVTPMTKKELRRRYQYALKLDYEDDHSESTHVYVYRTLGKDLRTLFEIADDTPQCFRENCEATITTLRKMYEEAKAACDPTGQENNQGPKGPKPDGDSGHPEASAV